MLFLESTYNLLKFFFFFFHGDGVGVVLILALVMALSLSHRLPSNCSLVVGRVSAQLPIAGWRVYRPTINQ